MQTCHRVLIMLVLVGLTVPSTASAQSTTGPNHWLVDYSFARHEAKKLGLPLLIHFSATWCGPCQQMERETLSSKALRSTFGTQLLALKVDSDESPGLIEAFRVDSLPSDVIVSPDGTIVARTSGYRTTSHYMASVRHWTKQFPDERAAAIAKLNPPAQTRPPMPNLRAMPPEQRAPVITGPRRPINPSAIAQSPDTGVPQSQLVGLSGYSPVAIKTRRVWAKGQQELSATWQGVVYYLANEREYVAFKNAPHRYAPRMLGCDPVLLWNSDRAVQGVVEYGAFYDGELYLFTTGENRNQFKVNPDQFVRVRHVLNPEEVIGTRIR